MALLYADSSAFAKLFVPEPETPSVEALVRGAALTSSDLLAVEAMRVARRFGGAALPRARGALASVGLIPLDAELRDRAGTLGPPELRALDAIHLATADRVRAAIDAILTYDQRLAAAAEALGIPVLSPA